MAKYFLARWSLGMAICVGLLTLSSAQAQTRNEDT